MSFSWWEFEHFSGSGMINGVGTKRRAQRGKYEFSKGTGWLVPPQPLTHTFTHLPNCFRLQHNSCFFSKKFGLIWTAAPAASVCVVGKINGWSLRLKTVWCLQTIDGGTKTHSTMRKTIFSITTKSFIVVGLILVLRILVAVCYGWLASTLLWLSSRVMNSEYLPEYPHRVWQWTTTEKFWCSLRLIIGISSPLAVINCNYKVGLKGPF